MSSPDYAQKLGYLRKKVGNYAKISKGKFNFSSSASSSQSFMSKIGEILTLKSAYIYAVVPLFILILLLLVRPSFITKELTYKDGTTKKKLCFKKLFIFFLIIGLLLDIAIFAYNKKRST